VPEAGDFVELIFPYQCAEMRNLTMDYYVKQRNSNGIPTHLITIIQKTYMENIIRVNFR
jgi:hypothetical protein